MHTVEIDFDVFKALTSRRASEEITYNHVLRELLGLGGKAIQPTSSGASIEAASAADWVSKGVRFPAGTEFRGTYKGRTILGKVAGGALQVNGKSYDSPSAAAIAISGNSVNGWVFWECRVPGTSSWRIIKSMRPSS
jgi:hypothetical protein